MNCLIILWHIAEGQCPRIKSLILLFSLVLDGWWFRTKIEGTTWAKVWWSCWWNNAWRIPGSTFSVWCDMGGGFRLVYYLNLKIRRVFLFKEYFRKTVVMKVKIERDYWKLCLVRCVVDYAYWAILSLRLMHV